MDPVAIHLKLGCLVNDIFRGSYLAAVMQPSASSELPQSIRSFKTKVRQRSIIDCLSSFCEHHRQLGDTIAMTTGIGTLRVNRTSKKVDNRVNKLILGCNKPCPLNTDSRQGGKGLNQVLVITIKWPDRRNCC